MSDKSLIEKRLALLQQSLDEANTAVRHYILVGRPVPAELVRSQERLLALVEEATNLHLGQIS